MTSRERVMTAMAREVPDRIPYDLSWGMTPLAYKTYVQKTGGLVSPEEYFKCDVRYVGFHEPIQATGLYDSYHFDLIDSPYFNIDSWGVGTRKSDDSIYHFSKIFSPLRNVDSINVIIDYPLPDYTNPKCYSFLEHHITAIHEAGFAVAGQGDLTLFELAWSIRGYESFMEDFLVRPDYAKCLLDRIMEIRLFIITQIVHAGVDVLTLGDDVSCQRGMMMSRQIFQKFLLPYYDKMIRTAKAINKNIHIFFHSDGNPGEIILDLIEIGVDILNPCQPECNDFLHLKKLYGDKLAFWGGVGLQDLLPFGTPNDIREEVKRIKQTLGDGGGLLLGPTHVIAPEVPWVNITALYEAIEEFGWYT